MKLYSKPAALKKGDTIAIVSPSSSIVNFPNRLSRASSFLESFGYRVRLMPNAQRSDGYSAGTAEERASDINQAFKDTSINAILCSTGGLTANAVLPFLDFDLIRKNPKIFCGYSDVTTLLLAFMSKSDMVVFHGPTLLPSFGEFEGSVGNTVNHFFQIISSREPCGIVPSATVCAAENLYWDKDDSRPLKMKDVVPPFVCGTIKTVSGRLVGGNLQTVALMVDSHFVPDFTGAVLVLEEEGLSTAWYERYLLRLEQAGLFSLIYGIVVGRPSNSFKEDASESRTLSSIMDSIGKRYQFPVLMNIDCGHSKPLMTLPFGCMGTINTEKCELVLDESGVV